MRRVLRQTVLLAVAGGVAAAAALLFGVDRGDLVLDAFLVYLAGIVALASARIAAGAFPAPRGVVPRAAARPKEQQLEPDSLKRMEGLVALAQADELDFHVRLRPILANIAAAGYAASGGTSGAALPASAEPAFTPETWEVVRPDRPRPAGAGAPGIDSKALSAVVGELESKLAP